MVYKSLAEVHAHQGETIHVTDRLHLVGVAMSGIDGHDPYKD